MNRRSVLAGVGTSLLGVAAGCTGRLGGDTDARSHIQAGVESLGAATSVLNTHESRLGGKGGVFDATQVLEHTNAARDEFEAARDDASPEQKTLLGNLGHLTDMVDGIAKVYEAVDRVLVDLDTIGKLVNSDRFEEATTQLQQTKTNLETVRSNVQTVTVASRKVDTDVYDEFEELDQSTFESWDEEMSIWVDGMEYIIGGFRPFLNGMQTFETATTDWEDEQYEAAAGKFEAANEEFTSALDEFSSGKQNGPAALRDDFEEFACKQRMFADGMNNYADAMRSAAAGEAEAYNRAVSNATDRLENTC